jgi:magnesium transporter
MAVKPDHDNIEFKTSTSHALANLYGLTPKVVAAVIACIADGNKDRLVSLVAPLHPADQADMIERLNSAQLKRFTLMMRENLDPTVLTYLPDSVLEDVVSSYGVNELAQALPELDSDDAVDILEDLEEEEVADILAALPVGERLIVEEALSYPEHCAGRLMQREVVVCPSHWTVGQSIDHLRAEDADQLPDEFYVIIIIDPARRVLGQVRLAKLLSSDRPVRLSDIMETAPHQIPVTMDKEEVGLLFQRYGLVSVSVVDAQEKLVGMITVDDIVDVIQEEAGEDLMALGGVSDSDLRSSLVATVQSRFLWLLVNLFTAVIASLVIGVFDDTIERLVALAVLMPIVASMGGNAGTQTVTVAVRALAMRQLVDTNIVNRFVLREAMVGLTNGLIFAIVAGVVALIWFQNIEIALVMGFAMIANMLAAAISGAGIPIILSKMNIDPAVASSVFITTVTDVIGFLTFLGLAAIYLV